jgi:WD40 repeat protein
MVHSDPVTGCGLVAVGSEDCSLCLLSLQPSSDSDSLDVSERRFLQGHISTVRALSTSPSGRRSHTLLFSGGARASLKVWKIRVGEVSGGDEPEVHLEAELSIHDDMDSHQRRKGKRRRRGRGPGAESLVPESRIMALTSLPLSPVVDGAPGRHYVAAGCSDGIIRFD